MINTYLGNVLEEFMPIIAPQLRGMAASAWTQSKPVAIVTPSPAKAQIVKSELFAAGIPMLGVEFWQPGDLRRHLARALGLALPLEDVRLLAAGIRSVAQDIAVAEPGNGTARALAKSAQSLADTVGMLEAAGWGHEQICTDPLRAIAKKFSDDFRAQGQMTVGASDFKLLAASREVGAEVTFAKLAIIGFDGLHWEHWPLLAAASILSDEVLVTLPMSYDTAGEADMVWCSSWEQLAKAPFQPVENEFVGNEGLSRLADHIDLRTHGGISDSENVPVDFIAAPNHIAEARSVVLRAAGAVAGGASAVGVLVPGPGPLAREITLALGRNGIDHYTTIPGYASPVPHSGSWPALLQALSDGTSDTLSVFLRTNGDIPDGLTDGKGSIYVADRLDRFSAEMLVSHVPTLRTLLETWKDDDGHLTAVKTFLKAWPTLLPTATFGEYLNAVQQFLQVLEWQELALSLAEARLAHYAALRLPLSCAAACDWLKVSLPSRRAHRTEHNGNPYAKIQVLTPTDAVGRSWDYLVFAGQVEGAWPPPLKPAGYLGEDAVRQLNQEARKLNAEATTTGMFGDGGMVVRTDKGYCVGPMDQRMMYLRDLIRLLKSVKGRITFSAAANDETDNGKIMQPGDFYRRVYLAMTAQNLDATVLHRIATSSVLPIELLAPKPAEFDVSSVRTAWNARNAEGKLSEYEFTLGDKPCSFPVSIAPSAWAKAFEKPAEVFLTHYIGVRPAGDTSTLPVRPAQGTWSHRFVEQAARTAQPGNPEAWVHAANESANQFCSEMEKALATHGRSIPDWWKSVLSQARSAARHFAAEAGRESQGLVVLTEKKIPRTNVVLNSGRTLSAGGRLDLLLSSSAPTSDLRFSGGTQWLWDFKTGSDKPLKGAKSLARFEGVQLALYLLALLGRGAGTVGAAIIRDGDTWIAQLTGEDLKAPEAQEALERLAYMQEFGLFGWTGIVRDPYSIGCKYPIATLPPTLSPTTKFNATHGL